ncbi:unannotated protein [freshwater metagenome]|uniref:Unannotated protein n=1 Tax=freshwater metagenome TaxID=449393 RepID=A0A6J6NZ65_9ZZZZ
MKPSQVPHLIQAPSLAKSTPIEFECGLTPAFFNLSNKLAIYGSCASGGYGNGLDLFGSVGSSPVVPWTLYNCSAWQ